MSKQEALLEVQGLSKSFGEKQVLNDVNLSINKGNVVVILGPSGCGKSTLLRCLNGLENIQAGKIIFDGSEVAQNEKSWQKMRQKIGMVFQSYDLFPNRTIMENILLGPVKVQKRKKHEVKKQAIELLTRVGLADRKNDYPRQLSGGQKQRVAIVRALCLNPELMLFDEVTASLDPEMVREVLEVMLQLASQDMTMVVVTHEMSFAEKIADQILFMENGKIIERTDGKTFFEDPTTDRAKQFLSSLNF
ncbi:amino acid ABC transporter ATP-binding protein [Niallia sp. 03190]|uniref:amino acid ABC transporter ATP-binding protein n=1 Tax=Niallia sp. 03190 TaxID=3458061 RepID=UPI0040440C9D